MSHQHTVEDETKAPFVGEDTRIKVDLKTLFIIVGSTALAVTAYVNFRTEVTGLKEATTSHAQQLFEIKKTVNELERKSDTQTELLKYIAGDRRGPVPDLKK